MVSYKVVELILKELIMKSTAKILKSLFIYVGVVFITSNALASNMDSISPVIKYDTIVSDKGPEISQQELVPFDSEKIALTANKLLTSQVSNTYTYVRCYYNLDDNELNISSINPSTNYLWARNPNNSYYKLNGYWYSAVSWGNMFYTDTNLQAIKDICDATIKQKFGNTKFSFYQVAADNQFSFNHTIWQNYLPSNQKYSTIISFGDSLSDNNNMYNASDWQLPNNTSYFEGRFTNGYTWVEYLSSDLNIPLYDWAVGGAEAKKSYGIIPGLDDQINSWVEYMKNAHGYQVNSTLFTIWIGANDLDAGKSYTDTINSLKNGLQILINNGAKNILVNTLPDLSLTPEFHMGSGDITKMHNNVLNCNAQISDIVLQYQQLYPDTRIMLFDVFSNFNEMLNNPDKFGFSNVTNSCLSINKVSNLNFIDKLKPRANCTDASKFVFWDLLHPTTHVHKIIADEVLNILN